MQAQLKATNSKDSVSNFLRISSSDISTLENEKAIWTEDVYFATETGKILEVDFRKALLFRSTTLYSLLMQAPQSYSRINRVRQMAGMEAERHLINGALNDNSH